MLQAGVPPKFPIPFANAAGSSYVRQVPTPSQIGISPGAASLTDGFPPVTFEPEGSGGTPPWGQDFNGILRQITQWSQWTQAGGPIQYDSTFQAAIGGYPKGALIQSKTTANKFWLSTVDSNTTNPDSGGAGWLAWGPNGAAGGVLSGTYPNPNFANFPGLTFLANLASGAAVPVPTPILDLVPELGWVVAGSTTIAAGHSGYDIQPNGYIRQWAYINITDHGNGVYAPEATWTYPIAFPGTGPLKVRAQNFAVFFGQTSGGFPGRSTAIVCSANNSQAQFALQNSDNTGTVATYLVEAEGF